MVNRYFNYLMHRDLHLSLHVGDHKISVGVGFPQGGVALAKFWLIAFDRAVEIINSFGVHGNAFADDCGAVVGGTNVTESRNRIQKMTGDLVAWGNSCGLRFNPSKTVVVLFTRKKTPYPMEIIIEGKSIPFSNTVKYLGVTLDRKLNWRQHINNKISKARSHLYCISNIVTKTWGPRPKLLRWAYTCIVRPAVTYAAMAWAHATGTETVKKKLLRVDRLAMLTIAAVHRSTPTRGLAIIYDILPLHLELRLLGLQAYVRQRSSCLLYTSPSPRDS